MTEDILDAARNLLAPDDFLGLPVDRAWRPVRAYAPTNPDGGEAVVFVSRHPAMFWRVVGKGVDLSTGSGDAMGRLAESIAQAIAGGMLGTTKGEEPPENSSAALG